MIENSNVSPIKQSTGDDDGEIQYSTWQRSFWVFYFSNNNNNTNNVNQSVVVFAGPSIKTIDCRSKHKFAVLLGAVPVEGNKKQNKNTLPLFCFSGRSARDCGGPHPPLSPRPQRHCSVHSGIPHGRDQRRSVRGTQEAGELLALRRRCWSTC